MPAIRILNLACVAGLALTGSGCGAIAYARDAEASAAPAIVISRAASEVERITPDLAVEGFYTWYLEYCNPGEGRNPLVDGAYRTRPELAPELVAEMDALLNGPEHVNYDPFLQAQDVPSSFELREVVMDGDLARVVLSTDFAGHMLAVDLIKRDGNWLIRNIQRADAPQSSAPSPQAEEALARAAAGAQGFYNWYIAFLNDGGVQAGPPSLLRDGAYKTCGFLAPSYIEELEAQLNSGEPLMADPFLCAQDIPEWVSVEQAVEASGGVEVTMASSFAGHRFGVLMRETEPGQWLVDGVHPISD